MILVSVQFKCLEKDDDDDDVSHFLVKLLWGEHGAGSHLCEDKKIVCLQTLLHAWQEVGRRWDLLLALNFLLCILVSCCFLVLVWMLLNGF